MLLSSDCVVLATWHIRLKKSDLHLSDRAFPWCAGYMSHLPKNRGFDLFSNLLLDASQASKT